MNLELLVRAIKSRTPISFEYNKADKTPGLRIGNAHAAFIMRRKDGTESTKVDPRAKDFRRRSAHQNLCQS
ncbi:MAG TPA: hypothetical protein VJU86_02565 [Pyrinomonadaceae bacterium]|nr:hypothetical protein [Pyrinomonadaceae bacterium]